MTLEQGKDILLNEGLSALNEKKSFGTSIVVIFIHILDCLVGDELDNVVFRYLGLQRETFLVNPNDPNSQELYVSDRYYADRAKLLVPTQIPYFLRFGSPNFGHVHSWTNYVGFTETYEYCTTCDEKKM